MEQVKSILRYFFHKRLVSSFALAGEWLHDGEAAGSTFDKIIGSSHLLPLKKKTPVVLAAKSQSGKYDAKDEDKTKK